MFVARLDSRDVAKRTLRRMKVLVALALFLAPLLIGGALAAAMQAGSPLLIAAAAAMMASGLAGLTAWVVIAARQARRPPRHIPWSDEDWVRFERSLWAHIGRSGLSGPHSWRDDEA